MVNNASGVLGIHSSELQALCLMTARGFSGLAAPFPSSAAAWPQLSWQAFAALQRGFAAAAVQPVTPEEGVQLTENAVVASFSTLAMGMPPIQGDR